jgi:hypothetical protein
MLAPVRRWRSQPLQLEVTVSAVGTWKLKVSTPMGQQTPTLTLNADGSGKLEGPLGKASFTDGTVNGDEAKFSVTMQIMGQSFKLDITAKTGGDTISGTMNTPMGPSTFSGTRI